MFRIGLILSIFIAFSANAASQFPIVEEPTPEFGKIYLGESSDAVANTFNTTEIHVNENEEDTIHIYIPGFTKIDNYLYSEEVSFVESKDYAKVISLSRTRELDEPLSKPIIAELLQKQFKAKPKYYTEDNIHKWEWKFTYFTAEVFLVFNDVSGRWTEIMVMSLSPKGTAYVSSKLAKPDINSNKINNKKIPVKQR